MQKGDIVKRKDGKSIFSTQHRGVVESDIFKQMGEDRIMIASSHSEDGYNNTQTMDVSDLEIAEEYASYPLNEMPEKVLKGNIDFFKKMVMIWGEDSKATLTAKLLIKNWEDELAKRKAVKWDTLKKTQKIQINQI